MLLVSALYFRLVLQGHFKLAYFKLRIILSDVKRLAGREVPLCGPYYKDPQNNQNSKIIENKNSTRLFGTVDH